MSDLNQVKDQLDKLQKELDDLISAVQSMESGNGKIAKSGEISLSPKKQKNSVKSKKTNDKQANKKDVTEQTADSVKPKDVEGIEGVFEGSHMVTEAGDKIEVPENYAAKTKLVFGDSLKAFDSDNGKRLFKHISKVPRKTVEGVLHNKDDSWSFVTDAGVYSVLKNAAEHRKAKDGCEAVVLLPENSEGCTFAILDKVISNEVPSESDENSGNGTTQTTEASTKPKKRRRKRSPKKDADTPESDSDKEAADTSDSETYNPRVISDEDLR